MGWRVEGGRTELLETAKCRGGGVALASLHHFASPFMWPVVLPLAQAPLKSCLWVRPGNRHRVLLCPGWLLSPRDSFIQQSGVRI